MKARTEIALIIGNHEKIEAGTVYSGGFEDFPEDIKNLIKKKSMWVTVTEQAPPAPAKPKAEPKPKAELKPKATKKTKPAVKKLKTRP